METSVPVKPQLQLTEVQQNHINMYRKSRLDGNSIYYVLSSVVEDYPDTEVFDADYFDENFLNSDSFVKCSKQEIEDEIALRIAEKRNLNAALQKYRNELSQLRETNLKNSITISVPEKLGKPRESNFLDANRNVDYRAMADAIDLYNESVKIYDNWLEEMATKDSIEMTIGDYMNLKHFNNRYIANESGLILLPIGFNYETYNEYNFMLVVEYIPLGIVSLPFDTKVNFIKVDDDYTISYRSWFNGENTVTIEFSRYTDIKILFVDGEFKSYDFSIGSKQGYSFDEFNEIEQQISKMKIMIQNIENHYGKVADEEV